MYNKLENSVYRMYNKQKKNEIVYTSLERFEIHRKNKRCDNTYQSVNRQQPQAFGPPPKPNFS